MLSVGVLAKMGEAFAMKILGFLACVWWKILFSGEKKLGSYSFFVKYF